MLRSSWLNRTSLCSSSTRTTTSSLSSARKAASSAWWRTVSTCGGRWGPWWGRGLSRAPPPGSTSTLLTARRRSRARSGTSESCPGARLRSFSLTLLTTRGLSWSDSATNTRNWVKQAPQHCAAGRMLWIILLQFYPWKYLVRRRDTNINTLLSSTKIHYFNNERSL